MSVNADFIVIGGGIAGLSAGAELARHASVIVLERETYTGTHATGRSAAYFAPAYGNETVRGLSGLCTEFFRSPPPGFTEVPLLRPRDALFIARDDQRASVIAMQRDVPTLALQSAKAICEQVPLIDPDYVNAGLLDTAGGDLDVDALLQAYTRQLKRLGGQVLTDWGVNALSYDKGSWTLMTAGGELTAPVIVNASGAWADSIAQLAGIPAMGIEPKRRTALLIDPPREHDITDWPLTIDIDEQFYFKPDAGCLMISPADEIPSEPCDAFPEEIDVAIAIDRFQRVTGFEPRLVKHQWAGLRSFAADSTFVVGADPHQPAFFWLAGQGGYGVQSAPALAKLSSHLLTGTTLDASFSGATQFARSVSPERFASGAR